MEKRIVNEKLLFETVQLLRKRIVDIIGYRRSANYKRPIANGFELYDLAKKRIGDSDIKPKLLEDLFLIAHDNLTCAILYILLRVEIKFRGLPKSAGRDFKLAHYSGLDSYVRDALNEEIVPGIINRLLSASTEKTVNSEMLKMKENCERLAEENKKLRHDLEVANQELAKERDTTLTMGPYIIPDLIGIAKVMKVLYDMRKFIKKDGQYASNSQDVLNYMIETKNEVNLFRKLNKGYNSDKDTFLKIFDEMRERASQLYDKHNSR